MTQPFLTPSVRLLPLSVLSALALLGVGALAGCNTDDSDSSGKNTIAAHQGDAGGTAGTGGLPDETSGTGGESGTAGTSGQDTTTVCHAGESRNCTMPATSFGEIPAGTQDCLGDGSAWNACEVLPCASEQDTPSCSMADGSAGARHCLSSLKMDDDGNNESYLVGLSACLSTAECKPGDQSACSLEGFYASCAVVDDHWGYPDHSCDTPLVLSFSESPVQFTQATGAFDLSGQSMSVETAWVSSVTPWLALDLDGNGRIDDGSELFGSMTRLPNHTRAKDGFEALAQYDSNHDGLISSADDIWSKLEVWADANQDRTSQPSELRPLSTTGVVAIDLHGHRTHRCDETLMACEGLQAPLAFTDATGQLSTGSVIDVFFGRR